MRPTGRWIALVIIGATALAGCVSVTVESPAGDADADVGASDTGDTGADDPEVVEGEVDPSDLTVGECVMLGALADADAADVVGFDTLPCEQPHEGEVILVDNGFFADVDSYDEQAIDDAAGSECLVVLEEYTAIAYDESAFDYLTVTPSQETWSLDDDRGLVCIGFTLSDDFTQVVETTGSIRGEPPAA